MSRPVLIISPDKKLNRILSKIVEFGGPYHKAVFLEHYPTFAQLGGFLADHPDAHAGVVGFEEPRSAARTIEILRVLQPDILAFGAHREPAPRLAAAALKAGAVDFLAPPWNPDALLGRLAGEEFPSPGDAPAVGALISFLPAQGGDGASTTALHVAHRLAEATLKADDPLGGVLFSDFDFHGSATAFRLRLNPPRTLLDALHATVDLDRSWPTFVTPWGPLSILAAPAQDPPEVSETKYLPTLLSSAKRRYRFTVVDLPPALYSACRDAAMLSERVFVVCCPDRISLHLAERRILDLLQLGLAPEQIKIVINRSNSETLLRPDQVPSIAGVEVAASLANDYGHVNEAYLSGQLVSPNSPYRTGADKLADKVFASL
ncbi:MAG: hypothetical protein GC160_27265 [Acidobacteria bacterium]|nr:hypothetical protein [Acidobacteriota bacterium]